MCTVVDAGVTHYVATSKCYTLLLRDHNKVLVVITFDDSGDLGNKSEGLWRHGDVENDQFGLKSRHPLT